MCREGGLKRASRGLWVFTKRLARYWRRLQRPDGPAHPLGANGQLAAGAEASGAARPRLARGACSSPPSRSVLCSRGAVADAELGGPRTGDDYVRSTNNPFGSDLLHSQIQLSCWLRL